MPRSVVPRLLVAGLAAATVAALPAVALAGSGGGDDDDERERHVTCSEGSRAELRAERDDGRLEVELEVDQGRSGVRWSVVIRRNGSRVVSTRATTRGRSGSFEVERHISDSPGPDRITARARSASGEVCRASVTI